MVIFGSLLAIFEARIYEAAGAVVKMG